MCGVVGFTGNKQAFLILLDDLSKLEYRGYDSDGTAVRDDDKTVETIKAKGKLKKLAEKHRMDTLYRAFVGLVIPDE